MYQHWGCVIHLHVICKQIEYNLEFKKNGFY